jgi:hypothetical protein
MTDAELRAWWPDLGLVVTELRGLGQPAVANALVDAVRAGATSSEILGGVGVVLHQHRGLRPRLSDAGNAAWIAAIDDVYRASPDLRTRHWLSKAGLRK